jgi:hypothetical protein
VSAHTPYDAITVVGERRDLELMREAVQADAEGQRALLEGRRTEARAAFSAAAELYRESWRNAPAGAYGRLVGMLKSSILAGRGEPAARFALEELGQAPADSRTAAYAQAIAASVVADGAIVTDAAGRMRGGSKALDRTADALTALAAGDQARYSDALGEIVADFEQRTEHLTGVPIADTAVMLERLAVPQGLETTISSPLLPR